MPESIERVRIGISMCLLGERVRYDGGHKRDSFLTDVFGHYVEWIPVCPEIEMGLGVPRDCLRLVDDGGGARLVAPKTGTDHTDRMLQYAAARLKALSDLRLSGYVLKRGSPSCGMERVRVYRNGVPMHKCGRGMFAGRLVEHFPHMPVEEEGRLADPVLRENFASRVFAYHRWQSSVEPALSPAAILAFHTQHKFLLMAHSQEETRLLGASLSAAAGHPSLRALASAYLTGFISIMSRKPTRKSHTNVLQHVAGYVSDRVDISDRRELTEVIDRYRRELLPLIVPITLIRHYVRRFEIAYLEKQVYLDPHPHELMLLNHV
jgi:uncharacterized protein YbgA (DUF1722 family)/uncharacterized protein YbbK (DUF523 family)